MAKEFLLEIGCEEIPAWMIPDALDFLADRLSAILVEHHLPIQRPRVLATPRRLVLHAPDMPERQPDRDEVVTGPPTAIACDAEGRFTKAAEGFARKQGVTPQALAVITTDKGEYIGLHRRVAGRPARDVLAEILPELIGAVPFPKTMYWRPDRFRFVRPVRSLLAILGGEIIPFTLAGVTAGDRTFGHRFLGAPQIQVKNFAEYVQRLRDNFVIVSPEERRAKIVTEIQSREKETGCQVWPDDALLAEVVYLNEFPTVIRGGFEERFLGIPREVLITVMRKHQKYFAMTRTDGALAPTFLAVTNMADDSEGLIRLGHERVLRARLVDAEFFWNGDRKVSLEERRRQLAGVLFQETLGNYLEKSDRLAALADCLAETHSLAPEAREGLVQAARLCKTDLVTEMVKELTELQGIMGGLYAREEGRPTEVWQVIYEHYRPEGLDDPPPETPGGALLALTDKTDNLVGMFGIGHVPSGSKDPFGLRRQAAALYRICLHHGLDFDLRRLLDTAADLLRDRLTVQPAELFGTLQEFLAARLRFFYQNDGFRYDEINAVLTRAVYRPVDGRRRLEALVAIRQVAAFQSIFTAQKRIKNILAKEADGRVREAPRPDLFQQEEEKQLFAVAEKLAGAVAGAIAAQRYGEALGHIEQFSRPVDVFFDEVLVMHPDPAVCDNRLRLLERVSRIFDSFCDFSQFVME
ncbi:MAG: glycine--tRNA ligase subunit beta [Acidobacteria bacterium]|nr:glycine--tRNA ligase subunit beta [Acidobacteriota bacterium]